jgi:predicted TIM-barrel fold metal-dependent hydrolase
MNDSSTAMLSADSHVIEPPTLWLERMDPSWGDRVPTVRRGDDGNDWWWVDGARSNSFAGGTQAGRRFAAAEALVLADRYENVPLDVADPHAFADANTGDGVQGSVLFPTQHLVHYKVRNTELLSACCRAYNDWLADFVGAEPQRLRGVAALNVDDVAESVREASRARALGLRAVMVPVSLPRGQSYAEARFDPLWAAVVDAGLAVCLHIGTDRVDPNLTTPTRPPGVAKPGAAGPPVLSSFVVADSIVRRSIADFIFGGVLERHPRLLVGSIEHEAGWAPHFVERLDYTYTERATKGLRFAGDARPSDFFRRQVFVTLSEDAIAVRERAIVGLDALLFATDFPHSESTYPRSAAAAQRLTAGLSDAESHRVLWANTARVFGFAD